MIGKYCVIRTYSAGVHVGVLYAHDNKMVTLHDARRIWYWDGANTLNEIALRGVGKGSKVSEIVEQIVLTEAIEIIPTTSVAEASLREATWKK
jgi:hypothetical protein